MKKILLTRSKKDNHKLRNLLQNNGCFVIEIPSIKSKGINPQDENEIISNWSEYSYIVFTSGRCVFYFKRWLKKRNLDLKSKKIFAVGKKTKERLKSLNVEDVIIPEIEDGFHLGRLITEKYEPSKTLIVTPQKGNEECKKILTENNFHCDELNLYKTVSKKLEMEDIDKMKDGVDIVFFASPSAVKPFLENEDALKIISKSKILPIGSTTQKFLKERGLNVLQPPSGTAPEEVFEEISKILKENET